MTSHRLDWHEHAACRTTDPELFFPLGTGRRARMQANEAKRLCHSCPVIQRCAETAVANGYEGIWGGLDDEERRRMRRGRLVAACHRTGT